jgi:pyruvate/2-oxoglutarate dehydrogenase complex dihydrolipoamide acyltransferase (E2) component
VRETVRVTRAPWPAMRNLVEGVLEQHRPHTYYGLCEADITEPLAAIASLQRRARVALSFHSYALYCLSRCAAEHPEMLTYRRGKELVTFQDADVGTTVEKRFPGGIRLPAVHTVRAAQEKSLAAINWELRQAIRTDQSHAREVRARRRLAVMPRLVRRAVFRRMQRDPFVLRRLYGTIALTNLQTPGFHRALYPLPPNICTLTLALGTVATRVAPGPGGAVGERKVLHLAAGVDHLVVDGMGMSRFAHRLMQLLESGAGLDDSFVEETLRLSGGSHP